MVKTCSAYNCKNRQVKGTKLSFYKFPLMKPDVLKKWVSAIGKRDFVPNHHHALCSEHFDARCFLQGYVNTKRLVDGAVPTRLERPDPHTQAKLDRRKQNLMNVKEEWNSMPDIVELGQKPPRLQGSSLQDAYASRSPESSKDSRHSPPSYVGKRLWEISKGKYLLKSDGPKVMVCCARRCTERSSNGSSVTFHSFPKYGRRRRQWIRAMKREDFVPPDGAKVCSKHFTQDCFTSRFGNMLRKGAVPTVFDFRGCKIYRHSSTESEDSDKGEMYSAAEYLIAEMPPDIKEEPLDFGDYTDPEVPSHTDALPYREPSQPSFASTSDPSRGVQSTRTLREPIVWLPRLPLLNRSDIAVVDVSSEEHVQKSAVRPRVSTTGASSPTLVCEPMETGTESNSRLPSDTALAGKFVPEPPVSSGPIIVSTCSVAKLGKNKQVSNPRKTPLPSLSLLINREEEEEDDAVPSVNMVFVKLVENWDNLDENMEQKLCVIETTSMDRDVDETTSGVTSWTMTLDESGKNRKDQEYAMNATKRKKRTRGRQTRTNEPLLVNDKEDPADNAADGPTDVGPSPVLGGTDTPTGDATIVPMPSEKEHLVEKRKDAPPNLLLVGPLSHSEETLAELHSQLAAERYKNMMLQRQLDKVKAEKNAMKNQLNMVQQRYRRLQIKMINAQLSKGVVVEAPLSSTQENGDHTLSGT